MMEYVLLEYETHKTFQCKMNQWRHNYRLKILWMEVSQTQVGANSCEAYYFALIERTKK